MADERVSQNLPKNPDPQEKRVSGDVLFQLLHNLRVDEQRRFWIAYPEADEDACDMREDLGQIVTEVKIVFPMSHNLSSTHFQGIEKGGRSDARLFDAWGY